MSRRGRGAHVRFVRAQGRPVGRKETSDHRRPDALIYACLLLPTLVFMLAMALDSLVR